MVDEDLGQKLNGPANCAEGAKGVCCGGDVETHVGGGSGVWLI